jgi:hypothetical protein
MVYPVSGTWWCLGTGRKSGPGNLTKRGHVLYLFSGRGYWQDSWGDQWVPGGLYIV